ncbi:MAG: hypothetical protein ACI8RZ_002120, partial [Myxococcota bacterium]
TERSLVYLFSLMSVASATDHAVSLSASHSAAESQAAASWELRTDSGIQIGLRGRAGQVHAVYLDGWPVSDGVALSGAGMLTLPLIHTDSVLLDLRTESGLRWLNATETTAPQSTNVVGLFQIGPVATMPVTDRFAAQLGWSALLNQQLSPTLTSDSIGQVLIGGGAIALTEDLQLSALAETGGLFGYDGDGAKYLLRGTVGIRWMPDQANHWFNL